MKFVDPPMAAFTLMAFSSDFRDTMSDGRTPSRTSSTMRLPARWARFLRRTSEAGMAAPAGKVSPRVSTMQAMVEAVPMVMQWPSLRVMQPSASRNSSSLMVPARNSVWKRWTSVPEPMLRPRYLPVSIGPPVTTMVGRSTLQAPISAPGVVLSHPVSSRTPSIGLARIDSSTSMLSRLR